MSKDTLRNRYNYIIYYFNGKNYQRIIVKIYREYESDNNYVAEYTVQVFDKPKFKISNKVWKKNIKYKMSDYLIQGNIACIKKWESSNPEVLEVDENGGFVIKKVGKVRITGYYGNKKVKKTIKIKNLE